MSAQTQSDRDLVRIVLFRNRGSELLLETTARGRRLPVICISNKSRVAAEIATAIRSVWHLDAFCLFALPSQDGEPLTHLAETCDPLSKAPAGLEWCSAATLARAMFASASEYLAVEGARAALNDSDQGRLNGAFGRLGWHVEVTAWVRAQARSAGLNPTGSFQQLNASPTFSLIRFETDGPALWFKAVGEPNLHEFGIALGLAEHFPAFFPRVIASNREWNAWLTVEEKGQHLTANSPLDSWCRAAFALADLQIASHGRGLHLIEMGARDVRTHALLDRVAPFFESMAHLMEEQSTPSTAALTTAELTALATEVRLAIEELGKNSMPNLLGHLDCNPGNILMSPERVVFLDCAGISVGHPFFTFEYLQEHHRRFHGTDTAAEQSLRCAYLERWQGFTLQRFLNAHARTVPLVAAFAYAASRQSWVCVNRQSQAARFFRSLTRRMKHESEALKREGSVWAS